MEDAVYYVRLNAVRELNDQSTLARIAAEDKDKYVQRAAFLKLSDPLLLATLMVDKRVPLELRHMAFPAALAAANVDFDKLAGNVDEWTSDALEAIGRMHRALEMPAVAERIPDATLDCKITPLSQNYSADAAYSQGAGTTIMGESVAFTIKRGTQVMARQTWSTKFPEKTYGPGFSPAHVDISGTMAKLLSLIGVPENELNKLSQSRVPEIRAGALEALQGPTVFAQISANNPAVRKSAVAEIDNQTLLAMFAFEDEELDVRVAAIAKLTDQAALARIAADENHPYDRVAAIEELTDLALVRTIQHKTHDSFVFDAAKKRLVALRAARALALAGPLDSALLARISADDSGIRESVVDQLKDQALLSMFAFKDDSWHVRAASVRKLTDQEALAKIAGADEDYMVRCAAVYSLTDQVLLKTIQENNPDPRVVDAAKERLGVLRRNPRGQVSAPR